MPTRPFSLSGINHTSSDALLHSFPFPYLPLLSPYSASPSTMRFTAVLAFIAAATVVSAATNAQRLARGLGPNAPGKRATPVERESC